MALQVGDVGVPREEPQQFMDDRLEMQLLGGQQREALGEVEAHLVAEQALGAGAGAVALVDALVANPAQEVEVLFRSEEHTSDLQSLMRISYAVFCLNTKN